jgi:hypothetical protein
MVPPAKVCGCRPIPAEQRTVHEVSSPVAAMERTKSREQPLLTLRDLRVGNEASKKSANVISRHAVPEEAAPTVAPLVPRMRLGLGSSNSAGGDELVGCQQVLLEDLAVVVHRHRFQQIAAERQLQRSWRCASSTAKSPARRDGTARAARSRAVSHRSRPSRRILRAAPRRRRRCGRTTRPGRRRVERQRSMYPGGSRTSGPSASACHTSSWCGRSSWCTGLRASGPARACRRRWR